MSSSRLSTIRLAIAAAACSMLAAVGLPLATAAPASDGQGYVDSTARCTPPETVVVFGSTESSRVAICKTPGGQYQYRGVRVRDGSKLILSASQSGDGGFVADNDGVTYYRDCEVIGRRRQQPGDSRGADGRLPQAGSARSPGSPVNADDDAAGRATLACRSGLHRTLAPHTPLITADAQTRRRIRDEALPFAKTGDERCPELVSRPHTREHSTFL